MSTLRVRKPEPRKYIDFGDDTPITGILQSPALPKTTEGIAMPVNGVPPVRRRVTLRRAGKRNGGDIVSTMLLIRNQVKLYHWQTKSFARHKATDDLVTSLDTNIDKFVEVFMGKYGRPRVTKTLPLHNFTESQAKTFVEKQVKYLQSALPKKLKSSDTDLLNIRDEILADLNQVRYLFTLS
jgi:hypothetical protein